MGSTLKSTIVLCQFLAVVHSVGFKNYLDYYWRDYTGNIPFDAFTGYIDGKTFYHVAQTQMIKNSETTIFPTTMISKDGKHDLKALHADMKAENIPNSKILCGQTPQNFKWVRVHGHDLRSLGQCHVIVGGYKIFPGLHNYTFVTIDRQTSKGVTYFEPLMDKLLELNPLKYTNSVFTLLTYGCVNLKTQVQDSVYIDFPKGHYWRDYNGVVPVDAIEAGSDFGGGDMFIGNQFNYRTNGSMKLFLLHKLTGQQFVADNYYMQILCTGNKDVISWKNVILKKENALENLRKKCALVRGGATKDDCIYYVGRIFYNGSTQVGGVFPKTGCYCKGNFCFDRESVGFDRFQVLTIDCIEDDE